MKEKVLKICLIGFGVLAFLLMFIDGYGNSNSSSTSKKYKKIIMLNGLVKSHLSHRTQREYPDYYGGSYLHDDQQHLVVQIVKTNIPDSSDEEYAIYEKLMKFDDAIIYEYVDNSYTELERVDTFVKDYFDKHSMSDYHVTTIGLEIMKNKVVIGLSENTSKNRQKFKENVIDSPVIEFAESNPVLN